ncbi:hypothetical protein [Escherichia coli]
MHIPPNFLPRSRQKLLRSAPGQSFPAVAVMPLAAKVLKQVMVNTGGNKEQVTASILTLMSRPCGMTQKWWCWSWADWKTVRHCWLR